MSSSSILYCNMAAEEYLTFHDVLLKIQGQLELLKRIHLQQLAVGHKVKVPQLLTGEEGGLVCKGTGSEKNYELQCGTGREFYEGSAAKVQDGDGDGVDLEKLNEQIQEQEFQFTESEVTKESDLFFRHDFRSAYSEFVDRNVGRTQGETIKMREINSALCNRNHVGTSLVEMGKISDVKMHLERKKLETVEVDLSRILKFKRRGDNLRNAFADDRKEPMHNRETLDKQDPTDKWAVANENDSRKAGNSDSFRRRKRKQENEKIHRTICDSKISGTTNSEEQQTTMAGDSPKKVGNGWTRVAPDSPGEMSSKVCSDEEVETTSKAKRSCIVGADYIENSGRDALRQEEAANGEKGYKHRCSPDASDGNKLCEKKSIDICKSKKEGNNGEARKQVEDQLGEFISRELPLKDGVMKGEAWKLYKSLLFKIVGLLSEDGENKGANTSGVEDAFLREQIENDKLRAEVAAGKDNLNHIVNLAEEGSRKCKYCQCIKQKLHIELKSNSRIDDACVSLLAEEQNGTDLDSEHIMEMDLAKSHRSPLGSFISDTGEPEKGCSKVEDDDFSLKRKRELEELRFLGKWKGKKSKSFLHSPLLREIGMVPYMGCNTDVERSSEHVPSFFPNTEDSMICKDLEVKTYRPEEVLGMMNRDERELPLKMDLQMEDENGELEFPNTSVIGSDKGFRASDTHEDPDIIVVKDEHHEGPTSESPIDVEDFFEGLKVLAGNGCESKFVDLKCGCTSQVYGDTVGVLRIEKTGMLEIYCRCSAACEKGNPMAPAAFERHAGRGSSRKWKDSIWVVLGDQKIQFSKVQGLDALYRHYKTLNHLKFTQTGNVKQQYHRDEFISCTKCLKERRFRQRNNEECRLYHDALMNPNWSCSKFPFNRFLTCEDDEEREVRRAIRGCVRARACQGCIYCVCLGCNMCRFSDCGCRSCDDYLRNST